MEIRMSFDFHTVGARLDGLDSVPAGNQRGRALEDLVIELLESLDGVRLAERNVVAGFMEAELDSIWVNDDPDHGLIGFAREVLVESKSSADPLGSPGVTHFAEQAHKRGIPWSSIVALNGISGDPQRANAAQQTIHDYAVRGTWIMVLVAQELRAVRSAEHLAAVIARKRIAQVGRMTAIILTAKEIAPLDPNCGIAIRGGMEALERAISNEEDRAINEILDAGR